MSGQAAESAKNQILNLSIFVSSLGGGLLLFEDEAGDEFRLGGCVLNIVTDRLTVIAQVEHDIGFDFDGPSGRERPKLDV
jgi:hypothetical protein